jgi:hypothetical protein
MSILDKVVTMKPGAPRITIYGKTGIGKSTLASQFPKPLFLLTEDPRIEGLKAIPEAKSFTEFWQNLKELLELQDFPYKTIVIDSVSKLDAKITKYIIDEEGGNSKATTLGAACGGYGKGYERAQSIHRAVKAQLDKFVERGIGVIFIAHETVTKYKAPDSEDYDIYSITMNHDKSREVYIHDVDAVLFARLQSFVDTLDGGKNIIRSTENRILVAGVNNSNVSKNRFAMPNEIPMEFEELKKYIPFYNQGEEK